jgi:hypothetical protein
MREIYGLYVDPRAVFARERDETLVTEVSPRR